RPLGDHADGLHGVELVPGAGDLGAAVGDGGDFGGGAGFDAGVAADEGGEGEGREGEEGGELHFDGGGMCLRRRGVEFDCVDGESLAIYTGACDSLLCFLLE
ncbi:hypothetical protein V502_10285, partial [Pseudogymnoascus sp. VKM F-4520 (FW-2644)]